jgi:glycogen operon protein
MASLLLAQGVPMILAGDEMGRTQRGNNNAYCHDDDRTWVDWRGLGEDRGFHRFVKGLVALRRSCAALRRDRFLLGGDADRDGAPDVRWIGPAGEWVDWERDPGHFGYALSGAAARTGAAADEPDLLVLVNLHAEGRPYRLPANRHGRHDWRLIVDTAAAPPADFRDPAGAPLWTDETFPVKSRSLAVFRATEGAPPA